MFNFLVISSLSENYIRDSLPAFRKEDFPIQSSLIQQGQQVFGRNMNQQQITDGNYRDISPFHADLNQRNYTDFLEKFVFFNTKKVIAHLSHPENLSELRYYSHTPVCFHKQFFIFFI